MSGIMFNYIPLLLLIYNVNSANILGLFPHVGRSHQMVFEPLLKRLAERGHNVTVASFFPLERPPPNYQDISFKGLSELRLESFDLGAFETQSILDRIPRLGSAVKQVSQLTPFAKDSVNICERLTNYRPLTDALRLKYDLVLVENFTSDCMLGLLYVFGITAPVVALLSGTPMPWTMRRVGADDNPSYVPLITSACTSRMSFIERLENTVLNVALKEWYYNEILVKERNVIEKKFGSIPDLLELEKNMSTILLNSFHVFNGVIPLVPGLVEVGGMHIVSERQRIPQYIQRFLNESENGVVLFSFGSHIKTKSLPKYKEEIFINALSKLKQNVIWKFEGSDEEGTLLGNILRIRWLPQYELLLHKKVKAFICHGGMLGMTEAVSAGKPMIVLPIFGDQPNNAAAAAEAGIAKVLSYKDLTEEDLTSALQAVLSDTMQNKAHLVSKMWHDRESSPLETAVFFTERAMRWGHSASLYSAARDLPFYQYALIDVAIVIILTILTFITTLVYITVKIIKLFKRNLKEKVH